MTIYPFNLPILGWATKYTNGQQLLGFDYCATDILVWIVHTLIQTDNWVCKISVQKGIHLKDMYKIQSVDQYSFTSDFTQEFLSRQQSKQATRKKRESVLVAQTLSLKKANSESVLATQTLSFMKAKEERSWQMHASPSQMLGQRLLYLDYHNYE